MTTQAVEAVTTTHEESEREAEHKRKLALLKAVGLDRAQPEQRELALAIAKRYDLDLLLKHLVLIEGRPYITRDALLHVAHRSGVLDGIEVTEPTVRQIEGVGEFWYCEASVYRKDMSRPFKYGGRYPTKGGNQKFAPEMATKVAEVMALRRAFDVSAPTAEERWDVEMPVPQSPPAAASLPLDETPVEAALAPVEGEFTPLAGPEVPEDGQPEPKGDPKAGMTQCESLSPFTEEGKPTHQCRREQGHKGAHRTTNESWS